MKRADYTFGGRIRTEESVEADWSDLLELKNEGLAFVYERLSTNEQTKKSIYSIKAQDALIDLAQEDGYAKDQVYVERRDLGISGTKGLEERRGLAHLIQQVEADIVEAVYVVHISRLYRDQTLINALALGELFKKHGVIIVTPQMRLNLRDKMHMRLYRMEIERAADELELMANRLLGARDLKAKSGFYAGEMLPAGYVVDERETLPTGEPNPAYHVYQIFEPHAQVVRTIFEKMAMPGMTPTWVARFCDRQGIAFSPFPPEVGTPANLKALVNSHPNPDGSWPVTIDRVRGIATNPAYIGWKIWSGEVIAKDVYPLIVDEQVFWTVQNKFGKESRPKRERVPMPLAGLLYCGNHPTPKRMTYVNKTPSYHSLYRCCAHKLRKICANITAHYLDDPISEAIISQLTLGGLSERTLQKYADEYEIAKKQAASYRREVHRLEAEVENLRANLTTGVMSVKQLEWLDEQIEQRLARIKELANLESQPIGAMIGHPVPGRATIENVRAFLENLPDKWKSMPNDLKNAVLRLLLDQVIIWHEPATVRVRLIWRVGDAQELLVHRRRRKKYRRWSEEEIQIVKEHFETADIENLTALLPGRTWEAIRTVGEKKLRLKRGKKRGGRGHRVPDRPYTPEEDELIRRYYEGEICQEEALSTGRAIIGVRARAAKLGLTMEPQQVVWEWLDESGIEQSEDSPSTVPPQYHFLASTP